VSAPLCGNRICKARASDEGGVRSRLDAVNVQAGFYVAASMNKNDLISSINEIHSYIILRCGAHRQKKAPLLAEQG